MFLSAKIKSFEVNAPTEKQAYIKGCKNLASLIASKKYTNLTFKVERSKKSENTFVFSVYTNIDLNSQQKEFCKICKEFHCKFYINEEYNCSRCNMKSFLQNAESRVRISKSYYKEII